MREYAGRLLLSAGDLNTFLGCRHATALAKRVLDGETIERGPADPTMDLVQRRGLQHEARFLERLRAEGRSITEVPTNQGVTKRVRDTVEAMRAGADVIFQAALGRGHWHGFADFLLRVEQESRLGGWSYEIADTKLASRAKAPHAIQLALYADLVEAVQGTPPPALRIKLGDGSEQVILPKDIVHYARLAGRRLEDFLGLGAVGTEAEPCGHCSICPFTDHCEAGWLAADHLSLVANMRGEQARKLREAGVGTLTALAGLADEQAVPGLRPEILERLRAQARLQHQARTAAATPHEILPVEAGRGFTRLPPPDEADIFFDMEGDPLYPGGGLEYLFGMETGGAFTAFWGHNRAQEKAAFEAFMDAVAARLAAHPGAHIYHYNHYEPTALKRLASRHATREAELDDLLRRRRFVDLYVVVREAMRIGEPRYSLKNVEHLFRSARAGDVETAGQSIVAYEKYCETGDEKLLDSIRDYNAIDCRSTAELRDWLLRVRPAGAAWCYPAIAASDPEREKKQRETEEERRRLRARLATGVAGDEAKYRTLVAELCDFHRREQKPQWWAMFARMEKDEEELLEDPEALAGLRADEAQRKEGRSFLRAYSFPKQDTKLRAGVKPTIAATLDAAGTIVELDQDACRIVLKRGTGSGALPDSLSLGPATPVEDDILRKAMQRFADSVAARDGAYAAVEGILRREMPRIAEHTPGTPILRDGESTLEAGLRAVANLQRSHLFIQGPPGTGKTWTTSRIALSLLKQGRRIGISSLSHKAIHNLLEGIEAAAQEDGFTFRGVKKGNEDKPESIFPGDVIQTVTSNQAVTAEHQLVAGTAWLFARPEHAQQFDTLFVDEAGQVSLANLVAMGLSARNIVLVGDQQQLPQPIQGVHPEGTGASALEHLLQGKATVPPERGILLDVSYRMHRDICDWVSGAIYDGRLRAHEDACRQRLILQEDVPAPLAPTGLRVHYVEHEGRSQSCEEEAEEIVRLFDVLTGQRWIDRDGTERQMRPEDILVVAHYNVQVNLLERRLPPGARVGTVDRFQGQEAPVVLVSMTSSSGDDLPRDIGFAFSRNRLNVAVSRAKCLAVILASPRLIETPCGTVEELRLVNTLCSAAAWSAAAAKPDAVTSREPSWRQAEADWDMGDRPSTFCP